MTLFFVSWRRRWKLRLRNYRKCSALFVNVRDIPWMTQRPIGGLTKAQVKAPIGQD